MRTLHISVLDKKATYLSRDGDIVCGNSDYMIEFAFDAEWDGYDEKTARFIWNGQYQDVKFTGTACYVPIVTHTTELRVGVYAGELSTTTSATIGCKKSILCESSSQGGTIIVDGGSSGGVVLPVPTDDDNGKVLTAKDSKVVWEETTGGAEVYEVESADDITADSPDGFYIAPSGSGSGTGSGSGGIAIHYYDSLDSVPADLPDGSFVAVPSAGGGGGMPVITLTTTPNLEGVELTEEETAQVEAALSSNACVVVLVQDDGPFATFVCTKHEIDEGIVFAGQFSYYDSTTNGLLLADAAVLYQNGAAMLAMSVRGS